MRMKKNRFFSVGLSRKMNFVLVLNTIIMNINFNFRPVSGLFILMFYVLINSAFGPVPQKEKTIVPQIVKDSFARQYPNIKAKWEKEGELYEACFCKGKTDITVCYDASGKMVET